MSDSLTEAVPRANACIERGRTLFRDGFLPECHDYMLRALRLQLDAWGRSSERVEGESPRAVQERALCILEGLGYRGIDRLRAAARAEETSSRPELASAPFAEIDAVWVEIERLTRFSARHALTPGARKYRQLWFGAVVLLLIVTVSLVGYLIWGRPRAHASAIYADQFAAKNAVDGLEATEWLLPDAAVGWIDVLLPRPRVVHAVRLLNAHNRFSADRAARSVRVTAFDAHGPLASQVGAFDALSETSSALRLPLQAAKVMRIRVEILTHFKSGGGLAEIEIE